MQVTVGMLRERGACYWQTDHQMARRCEASLPASPIDIARADWVPIEDRLWALLWPAIIPEDRLHLLACDFAEEVLPIFEASYPNDPRPRQSLEMKRRWVAGAATGKELADALTAGRCAAWDASREADWIALAAASEDPHAVSLPVPAAQAAAWAAVRASAREVVVTITTHNGVVRRAPAWFAARHAARATTQAGAQTAAAGTLSAAQNKQIGQVIEVLQAAV